MIIRTHDDLLTSSTTLFSDCETYRYRLWRVWDHKRSSIAFLMLNPSTADERANDPTVERCERRARTMGFGRLDIINLFALRSTDPKALYSIADPTGPENDQAIIDACGAATIVICAWGEHGKLHDRASKVRSLLSPFRAKTYALGVNQSLEPKHPLYVSYGATPVLYNLRLKEHIR